MRAILRSVLAGVLMIGGCLAVGGSSGRAQEPGLGGLLGGYGSMAGSSGMSTGGNTMVPYGGKFATAMPSGMSGGGGLSFQPRTQSMDAARPSFVLDSMEAMGRSAVGMGGRRPFRLSGGTLSDRLGVGGTGQMTAPGGMGGVMPPSFGYPFRQPLRLLFPSSSGTGMSM